MRVDFLYFEGCPAHEEYLPHLRELLAELAADEDLYLRRVESPEQAIAERFLGSPTVRVDGVDVDPRASGRSDYGMKCRLYPSEGRLLSAPPDELVTAAVRAAGGSAQTP